MINIKRTILKYQLRILIEKNKLILDLELHPDLEFNDVNQAFNRLAVLRLESRRIMSNNKERGSQDGDMFVQNAKREKSMELYEID